MKTLLAVDPGGTVGWARFDIETAKPTEFGKFKIEQDWEFERWLEKQTDVDEMVVEDYFIRPASMQKSKYAHAWDKGVALRQIGALKLLAFLNDITFTLQQPAVKPMGYKLLGKEYVKGKKGMHDYDALAHGVLHISKVHKTISTSAVQRR